MNRQKMITDRLESLKSRLPENVQLVAVSKYTNTDDIEYAWQSNQLDFGENRINELMAKAKYFHEKGYSQIKWHFIGKIQTNKVNKLLKTPNLAFIHSVDSLKLLKELYRKESLFISSQLPFFLQINTSCESQKQGFTEKSDIYQAIQLCLKKKPSKLKLLGLMSMASRNKDSRPCFQELASLRNELAKKFNLNNLKLSMGMGNDFDIALEEGTDFVRIGRLIFNNEAS